jgi:hypothetical protein
MRKTVKLFCQLGLATCVVLLCASCPNPLNPLPCWYHVYMRLGTLKLNLNNGPGFHRDDPTLALSPVGHSMVIQSTVGSEQGTSVEFYGWLNANTAGSYIGNYDGTIGSTYMCLAISENMTMYGYQMTAGSMSIDTLNAAGGDVTGTFDITFQSIADPAPDFGSPLVAKGAFRLLRVADSHYWE